jgi:hypothetical protein
MPKSISELKADIAREIKNISKDVLKRVFKNNIYKHRAVLRTLLPDMCRYAFYMM